MPVSNSNFGPIATLEPLTRHFRRMNPLKFVRKLARRLVRYFFYRFIYLRENAFCQKIAPFIKRTHTQSKEQWDCEYKEGAWNVLYQLHEQAHYAASLFYVVHLRPMPSILDVGCGEGLFYRWLKPFGYSHYTGIDLSEVAIANCASYCDGKTNFTAANAEEYVPETIFDVILFNESLYYLDEPGKVMERYGTYLAEDGFFVVSLWRNARSEAIRRFLKSKFLLIDETIVTNSKGSWFCIAFYAQAFGLISGSDRRVTP